MNENLPLLARENHDRTVRIVADDYMRRGYSVVIHPSASALPDFLQKFDPDIFAQSPTDAVVVEVKNGSVSQLLQWKRLAELLHKRPGWRFELVLGQGIDEVITNAAASLLTQEEVISLVRSARIVTAQGEMTAGFLTAWAALAGIMRAIARSENFDKVTFSEKGFASGLFSEAWMDREDYDAILELERYHNLVSHGFKVEEFKPEMTEQLCIFTERLICEWQEAKDKKEDTD